MKFMMLCSKTVHVMQREKCCYISFSYLGVRNVQKKDSCQVLHFNSFILHRGAEEVIYFPSKFCEA